MITVLIGENSFEITRALRRIESTFNGTAEKIDGVELNIKHVPDLLVGGMLFATKRLVIIKNLSDNKVIWAMLGEWLLRVSDDVHLVLLDSQLDKRTKTYKELQKNADIHEFSLWSERDTNAAEVWVMKEATDLNFTLDKKSAHMLVDRIGVNQWMLYHALQKLVVIDTVTPEVIEKLIENNPTENVFNLFEAALKGDTARVKQIVLTLELSEDPYRLFGLMSGQAFHLLALTLTDKPYAEVAKELGIHPFALSKLVLYAKALGKPGAKKVIIAFSEADAALKTSAADPWLLIERALMKTCGLSV